MFKFLKKNKIKGKTIIVFHVAIGNIEYKDVTEFVNKFRKEVISLKDYDDTELLFIPFRGEKSKIELLKP